MAAPLKIGVMGAGAVGCFVGGRLVAGGADVVFVGRPGRQRELEAGLVLEDLSGHTSRVAKESIVFVTDGGRLADRDVVLFCVKSGSTGATAASLAPVLAPGAIVVSLQNGVRNPAELRGQLRQAVLAGIVNFNIVSKGGGVFRRATTGPLVIEASGDPRLRGDGTGDPAADDLAIALRLAGFDVERSATIEELQWSKLLINLNNSVSALSDRPTRDIVLSAGYRRILAAVISESLAVLRSAGIKPAKLGAIPIGVLASALKWPTWLVRVVARAQLKIDPEARSSMWEDLTAKRPTEIDWINGEVVRLAESCGAAAPLNRRLVALIHEAEAAGAGSPKLPADELWRLLTRPEG